MTFGWALFMIVVVAVVANVFLSIQGRRRDLDMETTTRRMDAWLAIWADAWADPDVRTRLQAVLAQYPRSATPRTECWAVVALRRVVGLCSRVKTS